MMALYADASHTIPLPNPVVADADGRREKIEQRTSERRETEVQHRREEKRIAFLDEYADTLEKADRRQRFLQNLRRTSDGNQSRSMAEFMQWSEAHTISLRESCSASAVDQAVAESELWSLAKVGVP
jgi:erythromycin esterase-like protein